MDRVREERLSAEDLTKVQSGLSRLEEDIETFSAALGQLLTLKDNAGATRALSVNDRGTIFETQQQRQHDAAQRASRDGETVSLGADETGVGWLHAGMIIAGLVVMSAAMAWGTHSRKVRGDLYFVLIHEQHPPRGRFMRNRVSCFLVKLKMRHILSSSR